MVTEKEKRHDLALRAIEGLRAAAVEIVNLFAEKHELPRYDDRDTYFVDEFCDTCMFGDYAFRMQTMIEDLTDDLPEEELMRWYDYTCDYMETFGSSNDCPSFRAWNHGAPRLELGPIMEKKRELERTIAEVKAF
mgnify:CR=1 FL=1